MSRLPWLGRRVRATGVALFLVLFAVAALSPAAGALTARFVVNDGDTYTRWPQVAAGDGGWSPFFSPGIVVWDGGSIVAGHGADPGFEFPTQTLALVPRACRSYLSSTGGAMIADMLLEAPLEVDARYRATADLDVCMVQAGGGDFRKGGLAADVYEQLRTYCAGRRAAGFRVVVLTVLPQNVPVTFEASRLAYDQMVRDTWPEFADGLADIAADDRIGDTGDNFDLQFYGPDALHPNNAGCAVMASVTAPVLNGLPWLSARCEMRLRDAAAAAWSDWRPYAARSTAYLVEGDGPHTVEAEYRLDGGEAVRVSDDVFVDRVRPTPVALGTVVARREGLATLRYQIHDPAPCGPTATVVVKVRSSAGGVLRQFVRHRVPVGERRSLTFRCRLPRGSYRCVVTARDTAGNPQRAAAIARLIVR